MADLMLLADECCMLHERPRVNGLMPVQPETRRSQRFFDMMEPGLRAHGLAQAKPGQALQSTALVRDAGVRWLHPILSVTKASIWERRFFLVCATTFYVRSCDTIGCVVERFCVTFDVFWEG